MQNDISQRAAKRERLLTLLHETEGRLDDFIKRAKSDFDHAGLGPDIQTLGQAAVYLCELGLIADAQRLDNERKEWVIALTDIGFSSLAKNMSAKEKAALKRKYGPFPEPSDEKAQRLRKIALIGRAVRLDKVIKGLIHTCDKLSDLKADAGGQPAHWYTVPVAIVVSVLLFAGFEALVYYLPWNWLKNHPNRLRIQICSGVVILFSILWLFKPKWRKYWFAILLTFLDLVVSLLG